MKDFVVAAAVTVIMGIWTFVLYGPSVGIDDANIIHVYAANIAAGYGYVYNPGGEWVEGSTSATWTLVNVAAFAVPGHAEAWITLVCAVLTVATIMSSMQLARKFAYLSALPEWAAAVATAMAFMLYPAYFAWSVWTLMDVALWVFLLTWLLRCAVEIVVRSASGGRPSPLLAAGVMVSSATVPLTRPEGIVFTAVTLAIVLLHAAVLRSKGAAMVAAGSMISAAAAVAGITLWRLSMFGDPLPNTVYAKISTGWWAQFAGGSSYIATYFADTLSATTLALIFSALIFRIFSATAFKAFAKDGFGVGLTVAAGYALSILGIYVAAGGDYFSDHRFYQPLVPVMAGSLGVAFAAYSRAIFRSRPRAVLFAAGVAAIIIVLPRAFDFAGKQNDLGHTFRIAEENRLVGSIMNGLGWKPSVGMIAAGGFAFTYDGPVYDLVGLNWRDMAHAVDDLTGTYRGHGSFDKAVFFGAKPDILLPRRGWCTPAHQFDWFETMVLKGLADDEAFKSEYGVGCFAGLVFHARRKLLALHPEIAVR